MKIKRIVCLSDGLLYRHPGSCHLNELAKVTDVALAVSLHAPTDALRDELVPINRNILSPFCLTVFETTWGVSATSDQLLLSTPC